MNRNSDLATDIGIRRKRLDMDINIHIDTKLDLHLDTDLDRDLDRDVDIGVDIDVDIHVDTDILCMYVYAQLKKCICMYRRMWNMSSMGSMSKASARFRP